MIVATVSSSYQDFHRFTAFQSTASGVSIVNMYITASIMYDTSNSLSDVSFCKITFSVCNDNYDFYGTMIGVVN